MKVQGTKGSRCSRSVFCRVNQKYHDGRLVTETPFALPLVLMAIVAEIWREQVLLIGNEQHSSLKLMMAEEVIPF